jgi:hypothetical protein
MYSTLQKSPGRLATSLSLTDSAKAILEEIQRKLNVTLQMRRQESMSSAVTETAQESMSPTVTETAVRLMPDDQVCK